MIPSHNVAPFILSCMIFYLREPELRRVHLTHGSVAYYSRKKFFWVYFKQITLHC